MFAQAPIEPNELIDTTGIGWEELLLAVIVMVVAIVVGSVVRRFVRTATSKWVSTKPEHAVFLSKVAGWIVVLLGIVTALLILGFQLGPLLLILAIVAIVLFLSARNFLENFGAGIVLQTENPFNIGHMVEIADEIGAVREIAGRMTVLDTFDGRTVRIPNSQILNNPIVNHTERRMLRSELTVGVEYGTDLDKAQTVLLRTLEGIADVRTEPPPEAVVVEFGDSSVHFLVRFWHDPTRQAMYQVIDLVARAIDRELRKEAIVIAFPQMVVWPRNEEAPSE